MRPSGGRPSGETFDISRSSDHLSPHGLETPHTCGHATLFATRGAQYQDAYHRGSSERGTCPFWVGQRLLDIQGLIAQTSSAGVFRSQTPDVVIFSATWTPERLDPFPGTGFSSRVVF